MGLPNPQRSNRRRRPVAATPAPLRAGSFQRAAGVLSAIWARAIRYRRAFEQAGRVSVLIAVAVGAVAGGRLVERHVRRAEAFATVAIELSGVRTLTRDRVLSVAGLALGQNVFEVSPEDAERRLLADPWVQNAKVTRRLPGSYFIELTEQKAALVLVLGDELLLVGEDASVLKPVEPTDPVDLPLLTGADADRFGAELSYRSSLLVAAVGLLHDYRDAGLWAREPLGEIRVEPDQGLTLFVGDDATQVRLGQRPFAKKLRRLRGIFDQLARDRDRALYVYLDNVRRPDRATVRLR